MKPLIILSIIVVLFGAGCTTHSWEGKEEETLKEPTLEERVNSISKILGMAAGWMDNGDALPKQTTVADRLRLLEAKKPEPIMVTVSLKNPVNKGCIVWKLTSDGDKCEKDLIDDTTQIPLQEFVDLLDFKYVPATTTTSNQPAKLVK